MRPILLASLAAACEPRRVEPLAAGRLTDSDYATRSTASSSTATLRRLEDTIRNGQPMWSVEIRSATR